MLVLLSPHLGRVVFDLFAIIAMFSPTYFVNNPDLRLLTVMICRLFTAADSDDISTAVQFINRARPWTTLMAVGIGYGANMLTKYLAQVGEETPLTAATCLDNPFDLKMAAAAAAAAAGGSPSHQNLTDGFIDMLQSNKVVNSSIHYIFV